MSDSHYLGKNLAHFLRCVKFSGFLARSSGKLRNHIFISIAENIYLRSFVRSEVNAVQSNQYIGYERILVIGSFAELGRSKVYV